MGGGPEPKGGGGGGGFTGPDHPGHGNVAFVDPVYALLGAIADPFNVLAVSTRRFILTPNESAQTGTMEISFMQPEGPFLIDVLVIGWSDSDAPNMAQASQEIGKLEGEEIVFEPGPGERFVIKKDDAGIRLECPFFSLIAGLGVTPTGVYTEVI